jgi:hypothetical protein
VDRDGLINRNLLAATDSRANLVRCFVSGTPFVVTMKPRVEREEVILGSPFACDSPLHDQTFVSDAMKNTNWKYVTSIALSFIVIKSNKLNVKCE